MTTPATVASTRSMRSAERDLAAHPAGEHDQP